MCVHVFGGTSSTCYRNYALKRTAVDGETKLERKLLRPCKILFYADDLLKSVEECL